jgi:hypothetical protein
MSAQARVSDSLRAAQAIAPENAMPDKARLAELDEEIAAVRANLLELTEQAAAQSGAADEEFAAERIARQERLLASLQGQRDALLK